MNSNRIGVVIIGRNEGQRLVGCLTSLVNDCDDIVYVDSGSIDDSIVVANDFNAHVIELDLSQPFTAARARNAGFAALKNLKPDVEFVQFVDGDCEIAQGWLDKAFTFLIENPEVAVVCGLRQERYPQQSIYNRFCDDEWNTPIGEALACGGDSLMRVKSYEDVDGFRPGLIAGEEPELCVRLRQNGWKIWRIDADMTKHDAAMTRFSQWWRRAVRGGYGTAEVAWLHRRSSHGIWRRETARAVFWAGFVPIVIVAGAVLNPFMLWGFLVYPLQVLRLALRENPREAHSWRRAFFITLSKFAEFQGIVKFLWLRSRGQAATLIEYKGT